ncbi:uncharacterized, partial [Tachysurus ichikawai]
PGCLQMVNTAGAMLDSTVPDLSTGAERTVGRRSLLHTLTVMRPRSEETFRGS